MAIDFISLLDDSSSTSLPACFADAAKDLTLIRGTWSSVVSLVGHIGCVSASSHSHLSGLSVVFDRFGCKSYLWATAGEMGIVRGMVLDYCWGHLVVDPFLDRVHGEIEPEGQKYVAGEFEFGADVVCVEEYCLFTKATPLRAVVIDRVVIESTNHRVTENVEGCML